MRDLGRTLQSTAPSTLSELSNGDLRLISTRIALLEHEMARAAESPVLPACPVGDEWQSPPVSSPGPASVISLTPAQRGFDVGPPVHVRGPAQGLDVGLEAPSGKVPALALTATAASHAHQLRTHNGLMPFLASPRPPPCPEPRPRPCPSPPLLLPCPQDDASGSLGCTKDTQPALSPISAAEGTPGTSSLSAVEESHCLREANVCLLEGHSQMRAGLEGAAHVKNMAEQHIPEMTLHVNNEVCKDIAAAFGHARFPWESTLARRAKFPPVFPKLSPFFPFFVPVLGTAETAGVM